MVPGGLRLEDLYSKDFDNRIRGLDRKADVFTKNTQSLDNRTKGEPKRQNETGVVVLPGSLRTGLNSTRETGRPRGGQL